MNMYWSVNRRGVLKLGMGMAATLFSGATFSALRAAKLRATPRQTEGPFYPIRDQADKDADLTRLAGQQGQAAGDPIQVSGRILDEQGLPISGALVEIWQANKWGRYAHERDTNPAPLDPNFQGWGQLLSDDNGIYSFRSIFPGIYPAAPGWKRPPHIHFKVVKQGYHALTTQLYFPNQKLNETDRILRGLPAIDQEMLIAKDGGFQRENKERIARYSFDIVMQKV